LEVIVVVEPLFTRSSLLTATPLRTRDIGGAVSRNEGKIVGDGIEPVESADILSALAEMSESDADLRKGAVSCYLSASEGWKQARNVLGGAFAAPALWLRSAKEE
jgi:hypothetical protein